MKRYPLKKSSKWVPHMYRKNIDIQFRLQNLSDWRIVQSNASGLLPNEVLPDELAQLLVIYPDKMEKSISSSVIPQVFNTPAILEQITTLLKEPMDITEIKQMVNLSGKSGVLRLPAPPCPKCQSPSRLRIHRPQKNQRFYKIHSFYGCSQYPKCSGKKAIS